MLISMVFSFFLLYGFLISYPSISFCFFNTTNVSNLIHLSLLFFLRIVLIISAKSIRICIVFKKEGIVYEEFFETVQETGYASWKFIR